MGVTTDPTPFWTPKFLRNPHVQTVVGHCFSGLSFAYPSRIHQLALPDGDRLLLHDAVPDGWKPGMPIAVLLHGLSGSHRSGHVRRLARRLHLRQVRTVRVDLRGAGAGVALARKSYHAGCSDDVRSILHAAHSWAPTSPLLLIGISLGGNISLKLAGEAASQPVPGLRRVVALGPPIHLQRCSALIAQPSNRIYDRFFSRCLIKQVQKRHQFFDDLPRVHFPRNCTLRQFDEVYTAPSHGFASAEDYYLRCSAFPWMEAIHLPTLILTARDDPFIAVEPFEELTPNERVEIHIVPHGGHLGFLGPDGEGGLRWAERRVVDWLLDEKHGKA